MQTEAEDADGGTLSRQHNAGTLLPVSSEYVFVTICCLLWEKSKLSIEQEGMLPSEESRLLSIAGNTQSTDLCAQCVTELLSEVKLVPFMALQLFFALVITQMQSILMFAGRK